jgi:hypothetical protein
MGVLGFDSRRGLGIFLFTTACRTALGPTKPPIQWLPGALSLGVERPGREADHSPLSSAEVKERMELYIHSPNMPSWHGAQKNHRDFTFYVMKTMWRLSGTRILKFLSGIFLFLVAKMTAILQPCHIKLGGYPKSKKTLDLIKVIKFYCN